VLAAVRARALRGRGAAQASGSSSRFTVGPPSPPNQHDYVNDVMKVSSGEGDQPTTAGTTITFATPRGRTHHCSATGRGGGRVLDTGAGWAAGGHAPAVGSCVRQRFNDGKWYVGVVAGVADGPYPITVRFDDGDEETHDLASFRTQCKLVWAKPSRASPREPLNLHLCVHPCVCVSIHPEDKSRTELGSSTCSE
jgi:hypothetical protein